MRWYYRPGHPKASPHGFVEEADLGAEPVKQALHAPIMSGRFYENTKATDGADIGSRRKHRDYMREHGLTTADDFKTSWAKSEQQREAARDGHVPSKTRREALEREMYRISKP